MSLPNLLSEFRTSILDVRSLTSAAFTTDASGSLIFSRVNQDVIVNAAYLRAYISWETFLERAFLDYMMGEVSILGRTVTRFVAPKDLEHCNSMVLGVQKYVDWSRPEIVIKLSKAFFDTTNPFDSHLNSIYSDLNDMKTIRNSTAHMSSTTNTQLDALASRLLNRTVFDMKASILITSIDPGSTSGQTIFDRYLIMLDITAGNIADG